MDSDPSATVWNTRSTPEPANSRAIVPLVVSDIDENGNPPLDQTLPNPQTDRMTIRIVTTRLGDEEPHHWVVLFTPYYNSNDDSICIWYHVFHSSEAGVGYTSLIERASFNGCIVWNDWRSAEYVCWIPRVMHGEVIRLLDECLKRGNEEGQRWLRLFLRECVAMGILMVDRAAEIEWVVLPGQGEPGDNESYPEAETARSDDRMIWEG
ncbi:hypothetical protein ASPCAL14293 [Aspergillus calidoustus]|uniref:Uncharacterized protein n=1 Tax=Aspergillus calidoustus TaxID=454130 RepID=A0A0U5GH69_ASPCI|nr:hypothetical protein ASPCAL14293 [Aspergillus calidoustus]